MVAPVWAEDWGISSAAGCQNQGRATSPPRPTLAQPAWQPDPVGLSTQVSAGTQERLRGHRALRESRPLGGAHHGAKGLDASIPRN